MAQALANEANATKRQIQLWTDAGILRCLDGTDRQGRGRQRLYDDDEIKFSRFAAALAGLYLPIGVLINATEQYRALTTSPQWAIITSETIKWTQEPELAETCVVVQMRSIDVSTVI